MRIEKPIYFTKHAREQMGARNATEEEVIEAIKMSDWQSAERGRLTTSRVFPFNSEHYGRYYAVKEVIPIFVEERDRIIVITVYTYFFQRR
jgi:hypothetical protein